MIIKGKSRAGPSQLAHHLGRADTNERVEILQLDSAGTPAEAFRDWQTYTLATNGRLGLYHANIDPDTKYEMTPQQWARAVDILEEELGLQGQPRAVVMHEKNGREHIHVVWARADMDTMTLRSDSMNYQAHERASLRMEQEFGHEHVPGKHAKRDRDAQPEFPTADAQHDEWQQAERGGIDHRERKAQVTALYEASDTGPAFKAALEDAGYVLARGDRRDFVILDYDAKVHSLGRQLSGVKAADLRAFMADVDSESLPSVKEARAAIREAGRTALSPEADQSGLPDTTAEPSRQESTPAERDTPWPKDVAAEAERQHIDALRRAVMERHATELKEQELRHAHEVTVLQESQQAAAAKAIEDFAKEQARRVLAERPQEPGGFERLWRNIREAVDEEARSHRLADEARRAADLEDRRNDEIRIMVSGLDAAQRAEINTLVDRQGRERADLLNVQARDLKRAIEDDERARQLAREYEERQREALAREREGPERDPPRTLTGSRFLQSQPGLLLGQIASLVPQAAKSVSRFVRGTALALVPSLVSRFMAVARRAKKAKGGAGSASHAEITSSFFSTSSSTSEGVADGADLGSMFLAPPLAPRPKPPRVVRRRLRSRFRARQFLKPPWMR